MRAIQSLNELLTNSHQYENLAPILEVLLQYLQDSTFRSTHTDTLIHAIQHLRRVLGSDLANTYLETYSPACRRAYQTYVPANDDPSQIPIVDTDLEDDEETPRASIQAFQIKDKTPPLFNGNNHSDDSQQILSNRKPPLPIPPSSTTAANTPESIEFQSIVELMRSKWLSSNEGNRLAYLDRFKQACEKYLQLIRAQHLAVTSANDPQFQQVLHAFLTTILDLLSYVTSSNLELTIKLKLILSTCLGWLIKHAQVHYCKRNYKTISTVFKNILLNGQSNNRQLAVSSLQTVGESDKVTG